MLSHQSALAGISGDETEIIRAEGSFLFDAEGQKYIDFMMGWCVGNLGWNLREIQDAIRHFDGPSYVTPGRFYQPWEDLVSLLAEMAPGNLVRSFRATGGTESVDIALQIAMAHTRRGKFLSIDGSYHGNSIGTRGVTESRRKTKRAGSLSSFRLAPLLNGDALETVENLLKKEETAAFIMEPVICNLGVIIPEREFMQGVQNLCKRYGTLLIMDEISTGFGRTGKTFATEHFDLEPDILCMAMAITDGYAPMGATMITEDLKKTADKLEFYSTYGWPPLSVAAALANLRYWKIHQSELLGNVAKIGSLLEERASRMDFIRPAVIRRKGLAIGIDVSDAGYASKIKDQCRNAGLIVGAESHNLMLFPALNMDSETAHEGMDILERCVHGVVLRRRAG